jgi:5'-nucleotidase
MGNLTRRDFLFGSAGMLGGAVLAGCSQPSSSAASSATAGKSMPLLAIVHTNDTHGHDVEAAATASTQGNFSMAAVAQLAADYRDKGYQVILIDAGDAIQDTPLVDQSKGSTAMDFMNACGYQLMALGNHEFDWGVDNLRSLKEKATFPFLSANVVDATTKAPLFDANTTITLDDGTKVGFFGLTTPATLTMANPGNISGLSFLSGDDLLSCAQKQADGLRAAGCSYVVCVGHLGGDGSTEPNRSYDVLNKVTGIDLFVDGHDHKVENARMGGALLVETGCYLANIGAVTFEDGTISENLVAYGSYAGKDPAVDKLVTATNDEVNSALAFVVGTTPYLLDGNREPGVRTQETNLGDLVADAILWDALGHDGTCDCSYVNGGSIRASVQPGDVSIATVKSVLPYDGQVQITKVTGAQLLEAIEAATFETPKALGAFPQVSGITYAVDTSVAYEQGSQYPDSTYYAPAKPGSRVTISDVGGRGFGLSETYTLVSTDFVMNGGDTAYAIKQAVAANGTQSCEFDYEAVVSYFEENLQGAVREGYAQPQGRITIR